MTPIITIILTGKLCEPTGPHVSLCSQKPWRRYPSGIKVSKKELEDINLRRDPFNGEWNYTISQRGQKWVSIP
jgi:hypothetical protein